MRRCLFADLLELGGAVLGYLRLTFLEKVALDPGRCLRQGLQELSLRLSLSVVLRGQSSNRLLGGRLDGA